VYASRNLFRFFFFFLSSFESLLPEAVRLWVPDTAEGAASFGEQLEAQLMPFDAAWTERVSAAQVPIVTFLISSG